MSSPAPPADSALASPRRSSLGLLLRFISCGILSLGLGICWRLTLAPARLAVGSTLAGIFALLLGFIVGGSLWYLRDVRLRARVPERVDDGRIVFSFVVFVLTPGAVLLLVGGVALLALLLGAF